MNSPTKAGRTGTWATESLHRSGVGRERRAEPGLTVEPRAAGDPAAAASRQDHRRRGEGVRLGSAPDRQLDPAAIAHTQIRRLGAVPDRAACGGNAVAQKLVDDRSPRDQAFERSEVERPDRSLGTRPVDTAKRMRGGVKFARVGCEGAQFLYRRWDPCVAASLVFSRPAFLHQNGPKAALCQHKTSPATRRARANNDHAGQ